MLKSYVTGIGYSSFTIGLPAPVSQILNILADIRPVYSSDSGSWCYKVSIPFRYDETIASLIP